MALSSQARLVLTLPLLAGMMWGTQGDSSLQQQGPLITKTESHVLLIECPFPFSLAGLNSCCRSSVDLELSYRPHAYPLQREIVARLLNGEDKPLKSERFKDDPLVEARAEKIPEAKLQKEENCINCRTLIVTMPGSYGPQGEYSCSAVYFASDSDEDTTCTTYTVSVDEKRYDKVINGTFTVENVLAHKLEVRRQDSESLLRTVSVNRTTVDSQGCPLGNRSTAVELFSFHRNLGNHSSKPDGVLLSSLATQKTSTLTLFVRKDHFCYPDCTYSCEVNGRRCPENTACKMCTCTCKTCKCTGWMISTFTVPVLFFFLGVFLRRLWYACCDKICSWVRQKCGRRRRYYVNHQQTPSNVSETATSSQPHQTPSNVSETATSCQPHQTPSNVSETATSRQPHQTPNDPLRSDPSQSTAAQGTSLDFSHPIPEGDQHHHPDDTRMSVNGAASEIFSSDDGLEDYVSSENSANAQDISLSGGPVA